jgi:HD-GYP domain-containing protein (c-di-GMP phosphodiesterase class II)
MPDNRLFVDLPEQLRHFAGSSSLCQAVRAIGRLADADVDMRAAGPGDTSTRPAGRGMQVIPICYRDLALGGVSYHAEGDASTTAQAARAIASLVEHAVDREMAVTDLAEAMNTDYEELNMLYTVMSEIVARRHPFEIGQVVVDETARILNCRRVSLLVLDEDRHCLQVLASRGLPLDVARTSIPLTGTIAGQVLFDEGFLLVNDPAERPDLAGKSRGTYRTQSFVVVRVPLLARGEPVGILTATERHDNTEFTCRDRRLVEGLSSLAASALLTCRLHNAADRQMIGTIKALASAVDAKDPYTHTHSARVADLCMQMAFRMGVTGFQPCREIELAGLLHDIGKIGISDLLLRKPNRLSAEEYEVMKLHPSIGARIVEQVKGLEGVAKIILHHHERHDGLGYPTGLAREEIPLGSRLIAVADTFDALTSDRSYRKGMSTRDALREMGRNSGTQLAPEMVKAFAALISDSEAEPKADTSGSLPAGAAAKDPGVQLVKG